jgi:hypothetical protein
MKVLFALALIFHHSFVVAFTIAGNNVHSHRYQQQQQQQQPQSLRSREVTQVTTTSTSTTTLFNIQKGGSSSELGLPCVDECALESFPNLPPSVHPGVLSGQAQYDLLKHAKENGT